MSTRTAVYIGAGSDARPIRALVSATGVKRFVYIDSRPSTEHPVLDFMDRIRFPTLVDDVIGEFARNDVELVGRFQVVASPFVAEFARAADGVSVLYFFNTCFPLPADYPSELKAQIDRLLPQADTLIIAGFTPSKSILDLVGSGAPCHVALFEDSYYGLEEDDDEDSVVRELHTKPWRAASISFYQALFVSTACRTMRDAVRLR